MVYEEMIAENFMYALLSYVGFFCLIPLDSTTGFKFTNKSSDSFL